MTMRANFSQDTRTKESVRYYADGDYVVVDVHLRPASEMQGQVLNTGPKGYDFGILRFGPANVYVPSELAARIDKVLAEWKAEQDEPVVRDEDGVFYAAGTVE